MNRWKRIVAAAALAGGCDGSGGMNPDGSSTGGQGGSTEASTGAEGSADTVGASTSGESTQSGESGGSSESTGTPLDPQWQAFLDAREGYLEALAVPILDCIDNVDTGHAAFHGCVDWHSAVHATYSLHLIYRATSDPQYLDAANAALDPASVAAELAAIEAQALPPIEVPYGYAWFLALAVERERSTGESDLRPHAMEVSAQLDAWLGGLTAPGLQGGILSDAYGNVSWAVVNLWRWSQWTGDAALANRLELFVADVMLDPAYDESCPLSQELTDIDAFFPPCLHRAMAIATVDPVAAARWLPGALPMNFDLVPLGATEIQSAHQGGLNFSRAWGLWHLYTITSDPVWRDEYVEHIETHVAQPEYWAEEYLSFSHWVAQFGVYAIALTYE